MDLLFSVTIYKGIEDEDDEHEEKAAGAGQAYSAERRTHLRADSRRIGMPIPRFHQVFHPDRIA